MKVGIWGSYNHGNYGDDLMALQFATVLKQMGADPWVYRLDSKLAERYSVHTTHSLAELFQAARFCLIGGGAMLVDQQYISADMEQDFQDLYQACLQHKVPIFPISVGSGGRGVATDLSGARTQFWQNVACKASTVRLQEDVALLNTMGKEAIYYPDVLLTTNQFWNINVQKQNDGKLHVGINLGKSVYEKSLVARLYLTAHIRKDIVFHFIRTHLPGYPTTYEILPGQDSPNIRQHHYADILDTLSFLSSLDLLVSSKLHLGLTALTLGVPFYNFCGASKTQSFLTSIGAREAVFVKREFLRLSSILSSPQKILEAKSCFDFNALSTLQEMSWGHINFLKEVAQKMS
jgi:polysaccharide pyruvyl transferase WcaK-like protein